MVSRHTYESLDKEVKLPISRLLESPFFFNNRLMIAFNSISLESLRMSSSGLQRKIYRFPSDPIIVTFLGLCNEFRTSIFSAKPHSLASLPNGACVTNGCPFSGIEIVMLELIGIIKSRSDTILCKILKSLDNDKVFDVLSN